jgi:hypothetical protein
MALEGRANPDDLPRGARARETADPVSACPSADGKLLRTLVGQPVAIGPA